MTRQWGSDDNKYKARWQPNNRKQKKGEKNSKTNTIKELGKKSNGKVKRNREKKLRATKNITK